MQVSFFKLRKGCHQESIFFGFEAEALGLYTLTYLVYFLRVTTEYKLPIRYNQGKVEHLREFHHQQSIGLYHSIPHSLHI